MTMGLLCDRDGYDLRIRQCTQCGSRGCPRRDWCAPPPGCRLDASKDIVGKLSTDKLQLHVSPPPTPNLLLGSYINEDGDAT